MTSSTSPFAKVCVSSLPSPLKNGKTPIEFSAIGGSLGAVGSGMGVSAMSSVGRPNSRSKRNTRNAANTRLKIMEVYVRLKRRRRSSLGVTASRTALPSRNSRNHDRISAIGKPAITRLVTKVPAQSGTCSWSNTMSATWMMSQPRTR